MKGSHARKTSKNEFILQVYVYCGLEHNFQMTRVTLQPGGWLEGSYQISVTSSGGRAHEACKLCVFNVAFR
jgi:hypothetical protein